jgi:hypothetical protein
MRKLRTGKMNISYKAIRGAGLWFILKPGSFFSGGLVFCAKPVFFGTFAAYASYR